MSNHSSYPYTSHANRLADVIAAIQVLGEYRFHMSQFDRWAERISGDAEKGDYWKQIFIEHPEFFRLDRTRTMVSLVWRRQKPKSYDPERGQLLASEEAAKRLQAGQVLSRAPLDAADIKALIDSAISLHAGEVAERQHKKWWTPLAASVLGAGIALLGTALGLYASLS